MRILYLHYLDSTDTAMSHVRSFVDAAADCGHEVLEQPVKADFGVEPAGDGEGGVRGRAPSSRLKSALRRYLHEPKELLLNLRYYRREREVLARSRPDLVLARDHATTASFVSSVRAAGLPLVLEVNAPALEKKLFFSQYWHLPFAVELLQGWKVRRADRCIVVSAALRDHLVGRHGVPREKFRVVPNGADPTLFSADPRPAAPQAAAGESPVMVGFVGSFQKFHGTSLLTEMARRLGADNPGVRFLFVGDGPGLPAVKTSLAELGDRITFTGAVPHSEVPELVQRFDIGVVADAGFYMSPLKVFEWMAAAVAVVAPAHGPLQEVIEHGSEGLLFEPGSVDELVAALRRLVDDPDLRRRLGANARRKVLDSLTWRHNAERVLAVCEEVHHSRS